MKHHEPVIIGCGDVGARYGEVCVWGSDVGDRAEVIRCDDIDAGCGDVVARYGDIVARCGDVGARRGDDGDRAELLAISVRNLRRYRRLRSWYISADV